MKIFVTGNEACDADSFFSAFVAAKCLTKRTAIPHQPLAQVSRDDLYLLKREIPTLLETNKIEKSQILEAFLYETEIDWKSIPALVLTDHNTPNPKFRGRIPLIIDHHVVTEPVSADRKIIEMTASCCSLIAREFRDLLDTTDMQILLSVILLDSKNLTERMTPIDREMAEFLKAQLKWSDAHCSEIEKTLHATRHDESFWKNLTLDQQFKVDLKIFPEFSCATIRLDFQHQSGAVAPPSGLAAVSQLDQLQLAMQRRARKDEVHYVFGLFHGNEKTVVAWTDKDMLPLEDFLNQQTCLEPIRTSPNLESSLRAWKVKDKKMTRKQIAPLLAQFEF